MIRFIAMLATTALLAAVSHAQTPGNVSREQLIRTKIEAAQAAPVFNRSDGQLDVFRAMQAAGLPLTSTQKILLGEAAFSTGAAIEAEIALKPLAEAGIFGGASDPLAKRNMPLFELVVKRAASHRDGGLAGEENEAIIKDTGRGYVAVGEAHIGAANYTAAIRLINRGIARGGMTRSEVARANLVLGIAYFRAGDLNAARSAWNSVDADNGLRELAQAWLVISG